MRNLLSVKKPRYKYNNVIIKAENVIVFHKGKVNYENLNFNLLEEFDEENQKNEVITNILGVGNGYCPKYLKNRLKRLRGNYNKDKNKHVYDKFNEELNQSLSIYISLFYDDELFKMIIY